MGPSGVVVGFPQPSDRGSVASQADDYLVARVRSGDAAAFEAIYDRYARGMLGFCMHMLGNREAAEDALQLTFVSAYKALRDGDNSISLRPWLYTIARNRCLSELRAHRDALDVDVLAADRRLAEGLADEVQRREELRELLEDMRRLPADQRAALVLFELGDHPQKEIAAVLGVRIEKVKALIFQAREALLRGRQARNHPCADIRERLATLQGRIPRRGMIQAHIDRCPSCQSFEHEVRHQRAALALILPVTVTGELKGWVLGSALHGGGAAAAGVAACTGGGSTATAGACGSGAAVAGGATAAGGAGGAGVATGVATGGIASAGTGAATVAVVTGAPVAATATGLTAAGEYVASVGVGGLGATSVVAKIFTAVAVATVAAGASHVGRQALAPDPRPATGQHVLIASAGPAKASATASRASEGTTSTPLAAASGAAESTTATPPTVTSAVTDGTTSTPLAGVTSNTADDTTSAGPAPASGTTAGSASTPASTASGAAEGSASAPPAATSSTADATTSAGPAPASGTTAGSASTPASTVSGAADGSASAPPAATSSTADGTSATAPAAASSPSDGAASATSVPADDSASVPTATASSTADGTTSPGPTAGSSAADGPAPTIGSLKTTTP